MNQTGHEPLRLMSFGGGVVVESNKHNQNNEFDVMEEYTCYKIALGGNDWSSRWVREGFHEEVKPVLDL